MRSSRLACATRTSLTPPTSAQELGYVAEAVTDHLVAALAQGKLSKREDWWRSEPTE
jgi:hypothetical protein